MPELNDEFVQTVGDFQTVEVMLQTIHENLETSRKREYDTAYFNALIEEIVKISDLHYPPMALEEEIDRLMHSLEHDLEEQKMDLPTYLKMMNKEKDAFIEEDIKPAAKRTLEKTLIMDELARAEQVKLDQGELQREVLNSLQILGADPDFKKIRGARAQNLTENLTIQTASRLINRQVSERLKAIATGQAELAVEPAPEAAAEAAPETETPESSPAQPVAESADTPAAGEPASEQSQE
jgi:trigger factor